MRALDKETAIARMNAFGRKNTPFLFIIDYTQEQSYVEALDEIDTSVCLYRFGEAGNAPDADARYTGTIDWDFTPPSPADYRRSFDIVKRNLLGGNSYLTNLTCKVPLRTNLTLKDVFLHAHALYKLWLKDRFVCFSPEIFVRMEEGRIKSFPMKGTIDASVPDAERVILEDYKERSEHNTIVDLIRNDLNRVAERVDVKRFRYIDRLRVSRGEILQVSSEVTGRLTGDYYSRLGEIVFGMLPAGSISGAPKPSTLRIIARAEGERRGFYTGVFGYFDGKRLDSAVMIRYIEVRDGRYYFRSGGGITINSECRAEYEEVLAKVYLPFDK
mgnify:CR=1 FL=1